MNADRQRWHVPTSDELEQQGAISPATRESVERRGGLRRFFRAGRFRVSDDVAAKKHIGSVPTTVVTDSRPESSAASTTSVEAEPARPVTATRGQSETAGTADPTAAAPGRTAPIPTPLERPESAQPVAQTSGQRPPRRSIRIDQSVKDRRGAGGGPRA